MHSAKSSAWQARSSLVAILGLSVVCTSVFISAPVLADSRAVVQEHRPQPHVRVDGVDLVLNGAGLRNFMFFDVYVMALYLPKRVTDANSVLKQDLPRRLQITFLRDVLTERDVDFLMDGLVENNTQEELAVIQGQLDHFLRIVRAMGKIAKGGVVQLDYLPDVGTRVWLNQRLLGTVAGEAFNRSVLKIWLGDHPTQADLKKALLGEAQKAI
jgi:hypothetical protein